MDDEYFFQAVLVPQRVAHLTKNTRAELASFLCPRTGGTVYQDLTQRARRMDLAIWRRCFNKHHCLGGLQVSDIARLATVTSATPARPPNRLEDTHVGRDHAHYPREYIYYLASGFTVRHSEPSSHQRRT